jgi:hypothetical protein
MKLITLVIVCLLVCELSQSQTLVLKDSSNNTIASYIPGSRIRKQQLIEAKTIHLLYKDSAKPEFNFYLTTGLSDPFFIPGIYGNALRFNFGLHLGKLTLKKEAIMLFDVKRLHTKSGSRTLMEGGPSFYIIE